MPLRKSQIRRATAREKARTISISITTRKIDSYEGCRQLYVIYCFNSSGLVDLKPLFRIAGIAPDYSFSVTNEVREQIVAVSTQLLVEFSSSPLPTGRVRSCPKRIRVPCQGLLLAYLRLRITLVDSEGEGLEVTIQPRAVNRAA
jgi:hypothetical protein